MATIIPPLRLGGTPFSNYVRVVVVVVVVIVVGVMLCWVLFVMSVKTERN